MRLNKYLAAAGIASRRKADDLIRGGRITVNGEPATQPWIDVLPERDLVAFDGRTIEQPRDRIYLLMNKPPGVITTVSDTHGRPTVMTLLGQEYTDCGLAPVGRLDANTTGTLLLSNDGELAYRLTHPSFESQKVYRVTCTEAVDASTLKKIKIGFDLEDGPVIVDTVTRIDAYSVELVLHIGRKRIVRRIIDSLGYTVESLHRSRFAGLSADDLEPGAWRVLAPDEVDDLKSSVGLVPDA
ncbi:pseudouridine synthase [Candidatus Zixiibacteriota bacterium]